MTHVEYSRSFPSPVEETYDRVLPVPLERILGRRYLAIPAIKGTTQDGVWGREVGQQRTIHFSDGGSTREVLTSLDRPTSFGYSLADTTGPMKALVAGLDGTWAFAPAGTGTRITWSWDIRPTAAGRLAMPAFARMWQGTARQAFDEIEVLLVG